MKPLKITMSAFGSYADVQEIDFTRLGANGLYLITGETGSGKTTIFDAISFALFGKASGTGREDYMMLRSDFAADKVKTYVELDFVSGDNQYHIKRIIKKTGQEVVLLLPDGTSMSGDRNIKPKIAQIIGLDRNQFAQIVMIAQNDFLRFLQSGTDERLRILRHIFGTGTLKQFQERLKALVKQESEKRALILHDFSRYDVDIYKREEIFLKWETQIVSDQSDLSDVDHKLQESDKQKQVLAADLAVAEELFKRFNNLVKYRHDIAVHNKKANEIEEIKKGAARGEVALYKVKPLSDESQKATTNYNEAVADLKKANEVEMAAITELEEAQKAVEDLPPLKEAQDVFAGMLKEWETTTEKLSHLKVLQENRNEITEKQITLVKKQDELDASIELLGKLPLTSDCQTEHDKITAELEKIESKLSKLLELKNDFEVIHSKQARLSKEQEEFEVRNTRFMEADVKCHAWEEAFLRSQAGIIAQSLIKGEPCPVCGSTVHPMPAKMLDESVTEENLKKVREIKDKEQKARETQSSVCGALKVEIETLLERFLLELSILIPDTTSEAADVILPEIIGKTQLRIKELAEKKSSSEQSLSELKKNHEALVNKRDELIPAIASDQSEIQTLTKGFLNDFSRYVPGTSWESSETDLSQLISQTQHIVNNLTVRKETDKKALDMLIIEWDVAGKRRTKAESGVQSAKTLVGERSANEQKWLILRDKANMAYEDAWKNHNFADEAEYKAALLTEKNLAERKKQVMEYETYGEQLKRDISRLETETAGKEQPDMERLRRKAEEVSHESISLNEKRDEINGRLKKTESILKELRRISRDFEKMEKTYAAIKQLADTANGKLDFETYAQIAYFERVLHAANQRLKMMSQNRFTLQRKVTSDDGRKRLGLEIEVLDAYTGKLRSANSLSGGESFMASLSLALGLSDVVQQSAGGIHLDAMFIDEGFGSLDADVLELAIRTLSEMAGANRIVGIISHVTELSERIEKQVQVEKTTTGSKIRVVV